MIKCVGQCDADTSTQTPKARSVGIAQTVNCKVAKVLHILLHLDTKRLPPLLTEQLHAALAWLGVFAAARLAMATRSVAECGRAPSLGDREYPNSTAATTQKRC